MCKDLVTTVGLLVGVLVLVWVIMEGVGERNYQREYEEAILRGEEPPEQQPRLLARLLLGGTPPSMSYTLSARHEPPTGTDHVSCVITVPKVAGDEAQALPVTFSMSFGLVCLTFDSTPDGRMAVTAGDTAFSAEPVVPLVVVSLPHEFHVAVSSSGDVRCDDAHAKVLDSRGCTWSLQARINLVGDQLCPTFAGDLLAIRDVTFDGVVVDPSALKVTLTPGGAVLGSPVGVVCEDSRMSVMVIPVGVLQDTSNGRTYR